MPQLDGLDATRQIKKALPQVEVLILTMHDTEEMILGALEAGARGFVLKSMDTLDLIEAIKAISRRQTFVSTAGVRNFPLRSSQQRKLLFSKTYSYARPPYNRCRSLSHPYKSPTRLVLVRVLRSRKTSFRRTEFAPHRRPWANSHAPSPLQYVHKNQRCGRR